MWWIPHADYSWLNIINNFCMKKKRITKAWLHFISPCYILFNKIFPLLFGFITFFSICCTVCVCLEEVFFIKLFLLFSSFVCFVFNFFVFCFLFFFCFVFFFFPFHFRFVMYFFFILWILLCYLLFSVHLTVTFP